MKFIRLLGAVMTGGAAAVLTLLLLRRRPGRLRLDRELSAGRGAAASFLDAKAFPEIGFRSELLAWVPAGWRAVGRLQVKDAEHELACRFDLRLDDLRPGGPPGLKVASSLVIDSRWVTRQRIPALGRGIVMTCSLFLEPDM